MDEKEVRLYCVKGQDVKSKRQQFFIDNLILLMFRRGFFHSHHGEVKKDKSVMNGNANYETETDSYHTFSSIFIFYEQKKIYKRRNTIEVSLLNVHYEN
jgi:hypothetical protein